MTPQEIFETVARHLFTQGRRSIRDREDGYGQICAYRAPDGCQCAVGCLIPDDKYLVSMEGKSVTRLKEYNLPAFFPTNFGLLGALQGVHDELINWESSRAMRRALLGVAIFYDIKKVKFLDDLEFPTRPS